MVRINIPDQHKHYNQKSIDEGSRSERAKQRPLQLRLPFAQFGLDLFAFPCSAITKKKKKTNCTTINVCVFKTLKPTKTMIV